MQYAGPDRELPRSHDVTPGYSAPAAFAGGEPPATSAATTGNIPAGFDVESFVRNAKVNFIRLQAANDAGNLDDIREFTTPEMFAEIKMEMADHVAGGQTDVVTINGEVLDVAEEASRYVVSVRFNGLIREAANAPAEPFDEIWHMVKPRDGSRGWVLAGIQQVS
jgi:predicted lipid-binding transport protein (Tim44 family)